MPYRVTVRGAEVVADSLDDLDALLERYGDEVAAAVDSSGRIGGGAATLPRSGANAGKDGSLLKAFLDAGTAGVPSGIISQMVGGARGKALPPAMKRWAERVGLSGNDVFQKAFPNGQRGWRLSESAQGAARLLGK